MANTQLFDELFIDFVQSIFFKHPEMEFTGTDIYNHMPHFYKDQEMVNGSIHILMMREKIIQTRLSGKDLYKANPTAIELMKLGTENERLTKEIDLEIKKRTKEMLQWQKWPTKYWWLVIILTSFVTWLITKFFDK